MKLRQIAMLLMIILVLSGCSSGGNMAKESSASVPAITFDSALAQIEQDAAAVRDLVAGETGVPEWKSWREQLVEWCGVEQVEKQADITAWVTTSIPPEKRAKVLKVVGDYLDPLGYVSDPAIEDPSGGFLFTWNGPSGQLVLGSAENTTLSGNVPCTPVGTS